MKFSSLLLVVSFLASPCFAQVRFEGQPAASRQQFDVAAPTFIVTAPDVERLKKEDAIPKIGPLRYGTVLPVSIDLAASGELDATADDLLVSRIKVAAPGAFSIGLEFSHFDLPEGGKLFLYDEKLENVFGSYDQRDRIPTTGGFVIEPFPGGSVILEYSQPAKLREMPSIVVSGVIYDYRDVFALERGINIPQSNQTEATCTLVDVNCPEGAPYPLQKRATLRTLSGGALCSGSLINNTASDGTRYVYTANHCGQGTNTVFRFNYETAGCGTGAAPTNHSVSGATLLANDVDTDGRLLRITNAIPSSYLPYYSGWSRATANLTFGMSMHHPGGGPKKISIDNNGGGQSTQNFIGIGPVKVWNMSFNIGSTEGGSSGGPLFDQSNRIRGALTGGPDTSCSISYYGRLYSFWNEAPAVASFLDPNASGVTTLDGFDPFGVPPTLTSVSPGSVQAFSPGQVTLTGSSFAGASSVQVGSTVLSSPGGFTVVNDNTITLTAPVPSALGPTNVTVSGPAGTSSPVVLNYTETTPPQLVCPTLTFGGTGFQWDWGGPTSGTWILILSVNSNATFPYNGFNILLNNFTVASGAPDAKGFGSLPITIPTGLGGTVFYSQIVTTGLGIQASNITSTSIFF